MSLTIARASCDEHAILQQQAAATAVASHSDLHNSRRHEHELQAGFPRDNATSSGVLEDNGRFCEVLNGTEVEGFGVFVAPRMPDPELELEDADEAQPRLK
jgi:hypothetical protein